MKTIADLIAEHKFFQGLPPADLEFLAGCARNVHFETGQRLLTEGQPADEFFVIRSGRVVLGYHDPDRGDLVVDTLDGGDVVGWSWLFEPHRWHFDADAAEPVSAVAFDATCLRAKCDSDMRLCYELTQRFARLVVERLEATRLRMLDVYGPVASR